MLEFGDRTVGFLLLLLNRVLWGLTVDHYAGTWQGCNTSEDPCHRRLQGCDELEAHLHHKGGCCNWTLKYYSVIGERHSRKREREVFSDETLEHYETGEHRGVSGDTVMRWQSTMVCQGNSMVRQGRP